jgi:hypothetical protein
VNDDEAVLGPVFPLAVAQEVVIESEGSVDSADVYLSDGEAKHLMKKFSNAYTDLDDDDDDEHELADLGTYSRSDEAGSDEDTV